MTETGQSPPVAIFNLASTLTSDALTPVAETGFSHRLTAYTMLVGLHFFGLNISLNNQGFLESVTFLFNASMLSSEVAQ